MIAPHYIVNRICEQYTVSPLCSPLPTLSSVRDAEFNILAQGTVVTYVPSSTRLPPHRLIHVSPYIDGQLVSDVYAFTSPITARAVYCYVDDLPLC